MLIFLPTRLAVHAGLDDDDEALRHVVDLSILVALDHAAGVRLAAPPRTIPFIAWPTLALGIARVKDGAERRQLRWFHP